MKNLIIFCCIFLSSIGQAAFMTLKEDKLPLELVLLSESMNALKLTPTERDLISDHAKNINRNLKFLTKEQIYFLIKSEIYKNVLEKEFHGDFKIMKFTNIDLVNIEKSYESSKKDYSPFARWLVESVLSDFSELKNYPGFNNVKLDVVEKDPTLNLVRRKLSLLSPWLGAIAGLKAQDFNSRIKRLMFKIITDLDLTTTIYKANLVAKDQNADDLIQIQTISAKKLPIKETDMAPVAEEIKEKSLKEESAEEAAQAEKLVSELPDGPSAQEKSSEETAEKSPTTPRTWKPAEEKSKNGKTLPPPAPTWTPEN